MNQQYKCEITVKALINYFKKISPPPYYKQFLRKLVYISTILTLQRQGFPNSSKLGLCQETDHLKISRYLVRKVLRISDYSKYVAIIQNKTSGSAKRGQMALNGVYFRFTHRLGRPHYMWDEYLYSVLEKVEVMVTGMCKWRRGEVVYFLIARLYITGLD